jgi:hypothetical protein
MIHFIEATTLFDSRIQYIQIYFQEDIYAAEHSKSWQTIQT